MKKEYKRYKNTFGVKKTLTKKQKEIPLIKDVYKDECLKIQTYFAQQRYRASGYEMLKITNMWNNFDDLIYKKITDKKALLKMLKIIINLRSELLLKNEEVIKLKLKANTLN